MNERYERIFELAKQADLIQWDSLPSGARTPDHKSVVKARKFAELIVRECLSKVNEAVYAREMSGRYYPDSDGKKILKHFGVEE